MQTPREVLDELRRLAGKDSAISLAAAMVKNAHSILADAERAAVLEAKLAKEDRAHEQTCAERDAAAEALSQAYYLIIGESPEWSNHFGHSEALERIDDAQHALREAVKEATARADAAEAEVERLQNDGQWARGFKAGYHSRQQDLALAAHSRGKIDQYNDAIGPAVDEDECYRFARGEPLAPAHDGRAEQ